MNFAVSPTLTNPVTLNLFQGPSGRTLGASRRGTQPIGLLANLRSGWGAKWVLKQVQDDEEVVSGALRG